MKRKRLGPFYVDEVATGPGPDSNWVGFAATAKEAEVGFLFPTANVPVIAASLIRQAQETPPESPFDALVDAARHAENALFHPVKAFGVYLAADGETLLLNLGPGLLALRLLEPAKRELRTSAGSWTARGTDRLRRLPASSILRQKVADSAAWRGVGRED